MAASKKRAQAKQRKSIGKSVYSMHEAKTNLSKLVKKAIDGEEVVLANGKTPVARIVPLSKKIERSPGSLKGLFTWTDNAFAPLTDRELKQLGFE